MFVSVKKWVRIKDIFLRISLELEEEGGYLDFKKLEKDRDYLINISRTYRSMVSYLKGIH